MDREKKIEVKSFRDRVFKMVRRGELALVPSGDLVLQKGDTVILYSKEHLTYEERLLPV